MVLAVEAAVNMLKDDALRALVKVGIIPYAGIEESGKNRREIGRRRVKN